MQHAPSKHHYADRIGQQVESRQKGVSFLPKRGVVQMGSQRPSLLEMPREQYESLLQKPFREKSGQ
jgi:hypothetical protein